MVSNCFAEDVSAWPAWPRAREFQSTVFSCVAGVAKPDPEIYLKAIRGMGVDPHTAVFIGDGIDDELAGAEKAALPSVDTQNRQLIDTSKPAIN